MKALPYIMNIFGIAYGIFLTAIYGKLKWDGLRTFFRECKAIAVFASLLTTVYVICLHIFAFNVVAVVYFNCGNEYLLRPFLAMIFGTGIGIVIFGLFLREN